MHRKNGPAKAFYFKQFQIEHDRCAMKVGTDGVLLGAWANVENRKCILDVGTGSGLIALMVAQRSNAQPNIEAIEIDHESFVQACENIEASLWKDRIKIFHSALQTFQPEQAYDLIVCNPPYFVNSLKPENNSRATSRHSDHLPFFELIQFAKNHLTDNGSLQLVLPVVEGSNLIQLAAKESLFCNRKTDVTTRPGKPVERVLLEFTRHSIPTTKATLTLENENGERTKEFQQLVEDFYL
ncbi:MAG: methyltransferase [Cyclobacteriaceae bacterium]|nr:methyltransferase [Cyclobacteriaceae bacterium]